ncbi:tRNA uridine-5-carboxymethylaminomethyl(34) synthesis GTPase MnmE [Spiroplasma cantharicola]|uniref:tRNA modification GTPase MnmE n=1 Tax=Spiroplasma cantharicola TaxID=362837 RepID=A0A0M4JKK3_9MOLU|nr:tRNA uridine-5-carboxymethylaminomethyl(34) synthesis GTPase MnmE [Spiroplasma cantharicola]ALD66923.1 tRNA modification GTPase TrmE [Spiroplasma cantharicola]
MKLNINDTIVACATKIAKQAISIIRISGDNAFNITNKLLKEKLSNNTRIQIRKLFDKKDIIDEALILTFANGNSFTGENVVEIQCHGGILLTNHILSLLISNGARPALPGEFSQRAYLNGKINLIQAESINNLIDSKNELSLKISALNLEGKNNKALINMKEKLIDLISKIQTSIDYPDYDDVEGSSPEEISFELSSLKEDTIKILDVSKRFNFLKSGINTLILGETNVGKSSLLNTLISEEKAIVTEIEGTTRDIVEGELNFANFTLNLIDSAGIRETKNKVEKIGIDKSISLINTSNLILFVINKGKINYEIYEKIKNKKHLVVLNKSELLKKSDIDKIKKEFQDLVVVSAINGDIKELLNKIELEFNNGDILESDLPILSNVFHIEMFKNILVLLENSLNNIKEGFTTDLINVDLYEILKILNNLLGIYDADEEVIDNIFRKYCLGK